jgi:hypothetical protein
VAGVVLGGMALMAVLGLVYALLTQGVRRGHDFVKPKPESINVPLGLRLALGVYIIVLVYTLVRIWRRREGVPASEPVVPAPTRRLPWAMAAALGVLLVVLVFLTRGGRSPEGDSGWKPVRAVAPAELEGLGYLPADSRVVLGLHVAQAGEEQAGKQALEALNLLAPQGRTGLEPADLDHLVVGLTLDKQAARMTLVLRTRRPYHFNRVQKSLRLSRLGAAGRRALYSFAWEGRPALLWPPDERTLVVVSDLQGRQAPTMKAVPDQARKGSRAMPPLLQPLLRQRPLDLGNVFWLAANLDDPDARGRWAKLLGEPLGDLETMILGALAFAPDEDRDPAVGIRTVLLGVRQIRVGLRFDGKAALVGDFQSPDLKSAIQLEAFWKRSVTRLARLGSQFLPDFELKAERDPREHWVTVQVKASFSGKLPAR